MIDIHSHILPCVDDGSQSLETSRALLLKAKEEGITDIICTCHYDIEGLYHVPRAELLARMKEFKEQIKDIGINVYLGSEIYVYRRMLHELKARRSSTLANSYYVLVEFPFETYEEEYDDYLFDMKKFGCRIIIAHPERYSYVKEDPEFVYRWLNEGYLLQSNSSSFKHHKHTMEALMEMNAISFIASDGHNEKRPIKMKEAYDFVCEKYGKQRADLLFEINPGKVLRNELISI